MKPMSWGEHITSKLEGHVLVVTIDKPPFNHVSVDLMSDLALCLEAGDKEVRVRASVIQCSSLNRPAPQAAGITIRSAPRLVSVRVSSGKRRS